MYLKAIHSAFRLLDFVTLFVPRNRGRKSEATSTRLSAKYIPEVEVFDKYRTQH